MQPPDRLLHASQLPPSESKETPESPYSPDWNVVWEPHVAVRGGRFINSTRRPETQLQALMESAPFEDPETSVEDMGDMRERLADAIEGLEPRLRWIFEARVFRGLSIREVGRELNLSKSYVARLYDSSLVLLQEALADLVG